MQWWKKPVRLGADLLPIAPPLEERALLALYEEMPRLLVEPGAHVVDARLSSWSRAQHVEHVLASNELMLPLAARLLAGERVQVLAHAGPSAAGWIVLATGWIPRGQGEAPERVWPSAHPDLDRLRARLLRDRALIDAALQAWATGAHSRERYRHLVFGDLNARQWLRYARIHTLHHVRIARGLRPAD